MGSLDFELRTNPRVSLFQEIVCEGAGGTARSQAADISVGGMFIDVPSPPFAPQELVTARFALGSDERLIAVEAAVNYVQDGIGMGICFLNLDPADLERIAAFVDRTLHRPVLQGQIHLRKSSRVTVNVPVRVRTRPADGSELEETTSIITLSKHGACLLLSSRMDVERSCSWRRRVAASSGAAWSGWDTRRRPEPTARWASSAGGSPFRSASDSPERGTRVAQEGR